MMNWLDRRESEGRSAIGVPKRRRHGDGPRREPVDQLVLPCDLLVGQTLAIAADEEPAPRICRDLEIPVEGPAQHGPNIVHRSEPECLDHSDNAAQNLGSYCL